MYISPTKENEMDKVKIRAEIMWPYLDRVNDYTGKYQVDLANLSDAAVSALEELGIAVNNKEGKGNYIVCKSTKPIHAYNPTGETLEGVAIGNGSKAVAMIGFYDWTYGAKKGRSPSLKKLVVEDLVMYEGGDAPVAITDDDEIL
jgi:hypothetical protein